MGGDPDGDEGRDFELFPRREIDRVLIGLGGLSSNWPCFIGGGCVQSAGEPLAIELGSAAPANL